jgi:hypothetical protein
VNVYHEWHSVVVNRSKRSYKARLERFGLTRLQEIARDNGEGGRPKGKLQKKGGN